DAKTHLPIGACEICLWLKKQSMHSLDRTIKNENSESKMLVSVVVSNEVKVPINGKLFSVPTKKIRCHPWAPSLGAPKLAASITVCYGNIIWVPPERRQALAVNVSCL